MADRGEVDPVDAVSSGAQADVAQVDLPVVTMCNRNWLRDAEESEPE